MRPDSDFWMLKGMSILTTDGGASSETGTRNPARAIPAPSALTDRAAQVPTLSQAAVDADDAPLNQEVFIQSWLNREPEIWQLAPVVMLIIWTLFRAL